MDIVSPTAGSWREAVEARETATAVRRQEPTLRNARSFAGAHCESLCRRLGFSERDQEPPFLIPKREPHASKTLDKGQSVQGLKLGMIA